MKRGQEQRRERKGAQTIVAIWPGLQGFDLKHLTSLLRNDEVRQ